MSTRPWCTTAFKRPKNLWQFRRAVAILSGQEKAGDKGVQLSNKRRMFWRRSRGFNCSNKRPRPERRNTAERQQKQQLAGYPGSIRAGPTGCSGRSVHSKVGSEHGCEAQAGADGHKRTLLGEPCRLVDRPSPDVLGSPVIPTLVSLALLSCASSI